MENKILKLGIALFISMVLLGTLIYADENGIWHKAEDIQVGIFGLDEPNYNSGTDYYIFDNPVRFNGVLQGLNDIVYKGTELDARFVNENQANSISSAMITDLEVTSSDVNFNYADSGAKGGSAVNSNSCNSDTECEIATGTISGELKVNTIRSNGNGNVVIVLG